MSQLNFKIDGKTRIVRDIQVSDGETFEGFYRGWHISVYPMFGKLVNGAYCEDLKTGEFGVDVRGNDGGMIVNTVAESFRSALEMAIENILTCRRIRKV